MAARGLKRFIALLSSMALVLVMALAVVSFVPRAFGYMPFAVLSGSMEPELPVGSMVFVHQVDQADIAVGDRILSSGYGDIYPRGLVVGYVRSVQENEYTRALTAEIVCAAPISALDNVMIVTSFTQYAQ